MCYDERKSDDFIESDRIRSTYVFRYMLGGFLSEERALNATLCNMMNDGVVRVSDQQQSNVSFASLIALDST